MHSAEHSPPGRPYLGLTAEIVVDFVIMFVVMYAMIATPGHFYLNLNTLYMTLMMVAPMAIVMLAAMPSMVPSRQANMAVAAVAAAVFLAAFWAIRDQAAIGDAQFLRSMIPHHSGAILMCREASISDPRIVDLCGRIMESQTAEIAEMKALLGDL